MSEFITSLTQADYNEVQLAHLATGMYVALATVPDSNNTADDDAILLACIMGASGEAVISESNILVANGEEWDHIAIVEKAIIRCAKRLESVGIGKATLVKRSK